MARRRRLFVVTADGASWSRCRPVFVTLGRMRAGSPPEGVAILVRMKGAPVEVVAQRCEAVHVIARPRGIAVWIHTHVDLVARCGLDGAWLDGGDDVGAARAVLSPGALLGASRHAGDALDDPRLDCAMLSPIFPPTSKPDDVRPPLGLSGLRAAASSTQTPLFALGGIQAGNVADVIAAGAAGISVLGSIMAAGDPRAALHELLAAWQPS